MERKQSELSVITKAKDLCGYIMKITLKSPKQFRFTFISKLHNLALSVVENLFRANDVFVQKGDFKAIQERLDYQRKALTDIKLLAYVSLLATEQGCLLVKQYENIAKFSSECQAMLNGWITSDRKRFVP